MKIKYCSFYNKECFEPFCSVNNGEYICEYVFEIEDPCFNKSSDECDYE